MWGLLCNVLSFIAIVERRKLTCLLVQPLALFCRIEPLSVFDSTIN